jgi:tetratricopeptide (TPR) repeat protein
MVFERRDRAIKGLLALFVLTLQCVLSGCSLYFDEEHDKNVLNGMLVHEAYAELDDTLAKAEKKHRQHKLTAAQWEGRWASLANINADGIESRFDGWVSATGSPYAHLARGMFYQAKAWEARGSQSASETSEAQFGEFRRLAAQAEPDLTLAHSKIADCSICNAELLRVNRALNRPDPPRDELLRRALISDPRSRAAVFAYFVGLYPQWGGSFEQMRAFIDEVKPRLADPDVAAELESRFCWVQAGVAHNHGQAAEALAWYERGLTAHPYDMLIKHLAETYTAQGQHAKAVEVLEKNLELNDPWDLYTLEALAQAYFQSGRQSDGAKMMKKRDQAQERYNNFY